MNTEIDRWFRQAGSPTGDLTGLGGRALIDLALRGVDPPGAGTRPPLDRAEHVPAFAKWARRHGFAALADALLHSRVDMALGETGDQPQRIMATLELHVRLLRAGHLGHFGGAYDVEAGVYRTPPADRDQSPLRPW